MTAHHHAVHPEQSEPEVVDPVCGMTISPEDAVGHLEHGGTTYHFCSQSCLDRFKADPQKFLAPRPTSSSEAASAANVEYTCPMHPDVRQLGPGSCPICGMALEPVTATLEDSGDTELEDMTKRFRWSLVLTVPILAFMIAEFLPGQPLQALFSHAAVNWIELALATPVVLWGGRPFFERGWRSVVTLRLNMFTLIALGVGAAYAFSVVATLAPGIFPHSFRMAGTVGVYFEPAAVIVVLVLLGQVLELRARSRTSTAIKNLLRLSPKTAHRVATDGAESEVPLEHVHVGDRLRVRPGERVPVDGTVIEGASTVDESMVTGESIPIEKTANSPVTGGTINDTGTFVMEATRVGRDTLLARIVQMVSDAQRSRAPIQRLADSVSAWFVPAVILIAVGAFVAWSLAGPEPRMAHALVNAVAVLIIACPCALGLATPMSIMVGTGRGADAGVLFREAQALETMEKVTTLVVDKTGTVTEGRPKLAAVENGPGIAEPEFLGLVASLEAVSEHPLAAAIVTAARNRDLNLLKVKDFRSVTGLGVRGNVDGREVTVGNRRFFESLGIDVGVFDARVLTLRGLGQTVIYVAIDGMAAGIIGVVDPVKSTTPEALQSLRDNGLKIVMLTGDNRATADAVARTVGIDTVHADVLPDRKAEIVRQIQRGGEVVAMAGDGINDAPALALADVGIAMGSGTDVAMESAGVTLVKGDLRGIVRARRLSVATMKNIRQNLFFAFVYNVLGVPIAAGVLYPFFGVLLSPIIASAAMTLSSVSVIGNALRLRNAQL